MAQTKPKWEEIPEFLSMAEKLVSKYPDRFNGIDVSKIVAYGCKNKDRPPKKAKIYEMSGEPEPECFTNSKQYFVKFFMKDWDDRGEAQKLLLVFSALERIDRKNPGKVMPLDYRDQSVMIHTVGTDWYEKDNVPNLLKDTVQIRE